MVHGSQSELQQIRNSQSEMVPNSTLDSTLTPGVKKRRLFATFDRDEA